jgi:hypothetical protein
MGKQESKTAHKRHQSSPARASLPKPIDIQGPPTQHAPSEAEPRSPDAPPAPSLADESYQLPSAQYSRPPRLPLPIEEELHTPGSPIISPADISEPVDPLPRRSSVLSSGTADDDDLGDDLETLEGGPHPPVPTLIEWREEGVSVYVTGTFAGWDRKFRLHKKYVTLIISCLIFFPSLNDGHVSTMCPVQTCDCSPNYCPCLPCGCVTVSALSQCKQCTRGRFKR